jgi:hypothetical protein
MSWFGGGATSLEDVANHVQRQQQQQSADGEGRQGNDGEGTETKGGILVAPGVRFSEKLWTRLGGQMHETEKQKRREKLSGSTAFPEIPTSLFDSTFRRDAVWKQRCATCHARTAPLASALVPFLVFIFGPTSYHL